MFLGGLTPKSMCADDDYKLLDHGIGFTNVVMRATRGSANLNRKEIEEGEQILFGKFSSTFVFLDIFWPLLAPFRFTNVVIRATIENLTRGVGVYWGSVVGPLGP